MTCWISLRKFLTKQAHTNIGSGSEISPFLKAPFFSEKSGQGGFLVLNQSLLAALGVQKKMKSPPSKDLLHIWLQITLYFHPRILSWDVFRRGGTENPKFNSSRFSSPKIFAIFCHSYLIVVIFWIGEFPAVFDNFLKQPSGVGQQINVSLLKH